MNVYSVSQMRALGCTWFSAEWVFIVACQKSIGDGTSDGPEEELPALSIATTVPVGIGVIVGAETVGVVVVAVKTCTVGVGLPVDVVEPHPVAMNASATRIAIL